MFILLKVFKICFTKNYKKYKIKDKILIILFKYKFLVKL